VTPDDDDDSNGQSVRRALQRLEDHVLVGLLRCSDGIVICLQPEIVLVGRRDEHRNRQTDLSSHIYDVTFATPFISRMASDEYERRCIDKSIEWQSLFRKTAASGGIAGKLFEENTHSLLARGGRFTALKLSFEGQHLVLGDDGEEINLDLQPCQAERVPASVAASKCATIGYFIPAEATNRTFDSISRTDKADMAFQMTVSTTHSVNTAGMRLLSSIFGKDIPGRSPVGLPAFIFVLPTFDQPFRSGPIELKKHRTDFRYYALEIKDESSTRVILLS